jgi:diamine N-acetyltransferase
VAENNGLVYVADSEDVVVGYMALQQTPHSAVQARNPLQLWQLYVIPAFQGSGVAAQLIVAALAHARGRKHDVIWLGVSEHNDRAIAFYRKHGFESHGLHLVGIADHAHQDLLMSRSVV